MTWSVSADPEQFGEAMAYFSRRVVMEKEEALALGSDAAERAFWVGGGLQLTQVQRVFDSLEKAIEDGEPFAAWRDRVRVELRDPVHAETVYRNAVQQAYTAGRYRQMTEESVARFRPFFLYDSILDSRTTATCKERNGVCLPIDHPWWRTNYPPGHHRCRASVRNVRRSEAERRGITADPPKTSFPAGWGNEPNNRPVWKPKKKGKVDQDKLVDQLARKPRAKALPKIEPKPKVPTELDSPIRRRADELATALETGDYAKARGIIREHIEWQYPTTKSKDALWRSSIRPRGNELEVKDDLDASGYHGWDGVITVSAGKMEEAKRAARQIANGELEKTELYTTWGPLRLGKYPSPLEDPIPNVKGGFRTLIHEELHGFSRIRGGLYRGAAAVVEEVAVELTARSVIRDLSAGNKKYFKFLQGVSYELYVDAIADIMTDAVPGLTAQSAKEMFVTAATKSIFAEGAQMLRKEEYLGALTDSMDVTPEQRAQILLLLGNLRATHLPETHQTG